MIFKMFKPLKNHKLSTEKFWINLQKSQCETDRTCLWLEKAMETD